MFPSTYRRFLRLALFAIGLFVASHAGAQRTGVESGPVAIDSIHDVIQTWSTDVRLFIKGDIGVGTRQLIDLDEWLRENGSHWTIVLLETAAGEAYDARDGRRYADLDAVEHALGYGLSNRTGFGSLENSTTKEKDGAIFVLFLRERKFSYFSSDAQDRRGLGQSHWMGELDQPAFRAMRSGGRIVDAVKDTVRTINERLNNAIQAEASAARRAEQERQRAIEFLKAGLISAETSTQEVEKNSQAFHADFPSATGPLTNPPVSEWRKILADIRSDLTSDLTRANEQRLAKVVDEIARYLNAFAASRDVERQKKQIETRLQALNDSPNGVAKPFVEKAKIFIKTADERSRDGHLDVADSIINVEQVLGQAEEAVERENQRLAQVRLRSLWIRRTIIAMLAILGGLLASFLWILNRKRRPAMEAAKKAFLEREQSVRSETDHLDKLFQRNGEILGSRDRIIERGYTGLTRQVSEQALDYVDDLFIMSKEVNRVMEEARELVFPKSPIGKLVNLFSSFRYQVGINHLSGTPLRFTQRGGLPWILRDHISSANGSSRSDSKAELPDEIAMTFEDIYQAFKKRGEDAQLSLNKIEDSLANVHGTLEDLHKKLEEASQREQKLAMAARHDGYFGLPKFVEVLLPSIQSDLASADQLSAFDAVQAVEGPIPIASRKLNEADQLANRLEAARQNLFPKLTATAERLKQLGYASDWIDAALDEISSRADHWIELASKESVAAGVYEVSEFLDGVEKNAGKCIELAKAIQEEYRPALKALEIRIADTRSELGNAMKLPSDSMLRELDRQPDDCLSRSRDNVEAAKSMLIQGRTEAAAAAIDTMKMELARADFILRESKSAAESFSKVRFANVQSLESLRTRSEQLSRDIAVAKQNYAVPALMVRYSQAEPASDTAPSRTKIGAGIAGPNESKKSDAMVAIIPSAKMADVLVEDATASTKGIQRLLELSDAEHHQGQVLKAAERLKDADRELKYAHGLLQYVSEHLERLDGQSRANANQQQRCESLLGELQSNTQDPLVTERTLLAIEQAASSVRLNRQDIDAHRAAPNPFESAKVIELVRVRLEELQSQIIADRQGQAEAARAVAGAERQLEVAVQFVQRSQRDGITDSQLIVQLNQGIANYARELESIRQLLRTPHGDWQTVDDQASLLQTEISKTSEKLSDELRVANEALQSFQQASQSVYQTEQWSGAWGMRVSGSPGVNDLERARVALQSGSYQVVLELSRIAAAAAQNAIMQVEREIARRRMEEQREAEMARRAREAARRPRSSNRDFGGGFGNIFSGGSGGGFGGGSHGGSRGGNSSSGSSNTSGFSRSGW